MTGTENVVLVGEGKCLAECLSRDNLLPEQTLISLKVTYRASIRHGKHITPHLP